MRAGVEEAAEMPRGIRNRVRIGHADAVKAELAGFAGERGLQIGRGKLEALVQKSRST